MTFTTAFVKKEFGSEQITSYYEPDDCISIAERRYDNH